MQSLASGAGLRMCSLLLNKLSASSEGKGFASKAKSKTKCSKKSSTFLKLASRNCLLDEDDPSHACERYGKSKSERKSEGVGEVKKSNGKIGGSQYLSRFLNH